MRLRALGWPLEAAALATVAWVLRLLPVDFASGFGAVCGRLVGPRLRVTRRAEENLRLAFPDLSRPRIAEIVRGMWANLGRVTAEYPHLGRIADPGSGRVEVVDLHLIRECTDRGAPVILASAHLGNWEILPVVAARLGLDMAGVVREPNNPLVRPILRRLRGVAGGGLIPKGRGGARQAIDVLRQGRPLAFLFDQKMNDGVASELFGLPAMTPAAPAQLALRFECPLIPVRVERLDGARFRIVCHEPVALPASGDRAADVAAVMGALNRILEGWIRDRPEDWMWLHRRWPKAVYRSSGRG